MKTAEYWIRKLNLKKHPEGGYYREIYKSTRNVLTSRGKRSASTAIFFLLKYPDVSAFHRIASGELWHFYSGGEMSISILNPKNKKLENKILNAERGCFFVVVPAGAWFGASVKKSGTYALVGCTVAPGFEFKDFEMARRKNLLEHFPRHKKTILQLSVI